MILSEGWASRGCAGDHPGPLLLLVLRGSQRPSPNLRLGLCMISLASASSTLQIKMLITVGGNSGTPFPGHFFFFGTGD